LYVPVDPQSPETRAHGIFEDCQGTSARDDTAARRCDPDGRARERPVLLASGGPAPNALTWAEIESQSSDLVDDPTVGEHDLAYILYTSGSTGKPKGVCISHRNALAFVEWAAADLRAGPRDRFSNHAPFHFDLSVLDLYCAFLVGARVSIIPEAASYSAKRLVEFMCANEISIWYSVPSVLILMMDSGGLLDVDELPTPHDHLAGEVFPIKPLPHDAQSLAEAADLLNYYGSDRDERVHVVRGARYSGRAGQARSDRRRVVGRSRVGGRARTAASRIRASPANCSSRGRRSCSATGESRRTAPGPITPATSSCSCRTAANDFQGRKDHQVKVRGHRIELGEIEAALLAYPDLKDAAVVVAGDGPKARLVAFVVSSGGQKPSLLSIKRHCADRLPNYMIVDKVTSLGELPRTPNGKVDRLKLRQNGGNSSGSPPICWMMGSSL
jgi:non-ribosomal peptide synthetase component F